MLALLVLHRAKLLASNQSVLALGVAPMRVVSRWCRCVVQRLCATDFKRPCGVRAAAPHSAPARMPGVYAQRLYARTHTSGRTKSVQDAPTTNDHDCTDAEPTKHTQPFAVGKGFGVRDCKRAPFYKNRLLLIVVNLTTTSFLVYFLTDFALSDLLSPAFSAGDFFADSVHCRR